MTKKTITSEGLEKLEKENDDLLREIRLLKKTSKDDCIISKKSEKIYSQKSTISLHKESKERAVIISASKEEILKIISEKSKRIVELEELLNKKEDEISNSAFEKENLSEK